MSQLICVLRQQRITQDSSVKKETKTPLESREECIKRVNNMVNMGFIHPRHIMMQMIMCHVISSNRNR
jgi:hypothetical protein